MLKINVFLTRKAGLTAAEFDDHWTHTHTPLLVAMPETTTYARRYVQLHRTGDAPEGIPLAAYDGMAEIWVDDLAGAIAIFTSDYYRDIITVDEANFIDQSKTVVMFSEEAVIVGALTPTDVGVERTPVLS